MAHTLISFLGKSKFDPNTGYRTANYDFHGKLLHGAFFGLELSKHIHPDQLRQHVGCVFF